MSKVKKKTLLRRKHEGLTGREIEDNYRHVQFLLKTPQKKVKEIEEMEEEENISELHRWKGSCGSCETSVF